MTLVLILATLLFCSCSADEYEYCTDRQCYFVFDSSIHNVCILNNALNPFSSGVFCQVKQEPRNGVRHLILQLQDGKTTEEVAITTATETQRSCILGAGNGLVIGFSALNQQLYAFDLQCPNCLKTHYPYVKYPLKWSNNGNWLKCESCQRSYDLNNGGIVASGESGLKLLRYRSDYTGQMLFVRN